MVVSGVIGQGQINPFTKMLPTQNGRACQRIRKLSIGAVLVTLAHSIMKYRYLLSFFLCLAIGCSNGRYSAEDENPHAALVANWRREHCVQGGISSGLIQSYVKNKEFEKIVNEGEAIVPYLASVLIAENDDGTKTVHNRCDSFLIIALCQIRDVPWDYSVVKDENFVRMMEQLGFAQ